MSELSIARAELGRLHDQIARLEQDLVEVQARANAAVAAAQDRTYWLDRWHLDLNALMRRPVATQLRALARVARAQARRARRIKQAI